MWLARLRGLSRQIAHCFSGNEYPLHFISFGVRPMKPYALATLLLVGLTAPAFANMANQDSRDTSPNFSFDAKDHWAVVDTVGNCAVIDSHPSPYRISGLKTLGDRSGYSSLSAANQEISSDKSACKGLVERT
jgi:hypothetical protein